MIRSIGILAILFLIPSLGCKTKADLRREQELARIQAQLAADRDSLGTDTQEMKMEISRLSGLVEELFQGVRAMQSDLEGMNNRLKALETPKPPPPQPAAPARSDRMSYGAAKALFDAGKFAEAIPAFEEVLGSKPSLTDKKNAMFLLAESYFANKQYGEAAIEYSGFKKDFPKDDRVAQAIYRQANCFRNLGKGREAKLFYQELLDRYPKSSYAARSRKEMATLK